MVPVGGSTSSDPAAMVRLLQLLALNCLLCIVSAHNSLMIPVPRNAMDGVDPRMKNGGAIPGGLTCTCANSRDCPMGSAREVAGAGQACLWWSQGCSIGCPYCLTDPKHPDNGGKVGGLIDVIRL